MRAPAHTSSVGYFVEDPMISYESRPHGYAWKSYTNRPLSGYSLKSPVNKSDGVRPTNYFRKVGRAMSLGSYHMKSPSHETRGDDSRAFVSLDAAAHGSFANSPNVPVPQWMVNQTVQQCMQDLLDLRANIMEDFGQARQTVTMVGNIFNLIVKLYVYARKGQWRKLRRLFRGLGYNPSKKIANGWLMYYYGIRPMISTIDALLSAGGPKQKVLSVKRKLSTNVDSLAFCSGNALVADGVAQFRVLTKLTVHLNMDDSTSYWTSLGITGNYIDDALVTTWALLPYSFVLDWILPVERFLRTRRFTSAVDYRHGSISRSLTCDTICSGNASRLVFGPYTGKRPTCRIVAVHFQRTVYNYNPPTGLALNLSLTPTNLINASALLIQRR